MKKEEKIILSLIVGIYHFIMPLIGLYFGTLIDEISFINLHIISSIILLYIGIDLIISNYKEENNLTVSILGFIMFGLSVSIDSLTIGIGLKAITNDYLISSLIFSTSSLIFTYIGLLFGNIIGNKIGAYAKTIGGIVLIIIAIIMFIK
jgi:putative Mn2+ efflux pump MntP